MTSHTDDWLSKFAFAEYDMPMDVVENEDDGDDETQDFVQWMTSNKRVFFPASKNVKKLTPGFYEIGETPHGQLFYKKVNLNTEQLIKFPETSIDEVVQEIETFWDREAKFREANLAFKRGILMYGPPGSGKTSAIKMILNNIVKRGGIVIKFEHPGLFTAGMKVLREIQEDTPVVGLMEDLDSILEWNSESKVINVIDGMEGFDKIVFLATTNYPEKLGSRIMNRPSRFDKRVFVGMPNAESRKIYLEAKLEGKKPEGGLARWVADTDGFSIAHLKELVVAVTIMDMDYNETVSRLKGMADKIDSKAWDNFGEGDAFASTGDIDANYTALMKAIKADRQDIMSKFAKHKDKLPGGLADDKEPSDFDSDQLKKGVRAELEHTKDRALAKEIAMDHLTEDPKYYDKLEDCVEAGGDKQWVFANCKFAEKGKAVNPWAVCTKSVGRDDPDKYERCVQDVKKKHKIKESDEGRKEASLTPSGWNHPGLPGQFFKSKEALETRLAKTVGKEQAEETHETFEERNPEHPTKECIERMKKEKSIDDPGAFCAKIRDKAEGDTDWRGEDDKKKD